MLIGHTTTALAYDATAVQIETALDALTSITSAGGVTVTGNAGGPFTVVFDSAGARTQIAGDLGSITPTSDLNVFTKVEGDVSTAEIQVLKIKESPIALQTSFSALSAPTIALTSQVSPR